MRIATEMFQQFDNESLNKHVYREAKRIVKNSVAYFSSFFP
jgi:hypothetical protein